MIQIPEKLFDEMVKSLRVLSRISEAYTANELDDEARRFWGVNDKHECTTPPEKIELYTGRGGRTLLTLADTIQAQKVLLDLVSSRRSL